MQSIIFVSLNSVSLRLMSSQYAHSIFTIITLCLHLFTICLPYILHVFTSVYMWLHVLMCVHHLFTCVYMCLPSVYMCLHVFTCVYHLFTICLHVFTCAYMCLHVLTCVYMCLPSVYNVFTMCLHVFIICLHVFTCVYICLHVFTMCLHVFTCVYMCLHVFTGGQLGLWIGISVFTLFEILNFLSQMLQVFVGSCRKSRKTITVEPAANNVKKIQP